ncbi:MAG: type III pantothenate kinase [Planctomycetota bacterium]|jgi:type III pantothenate kinase|nr:type III pantothenate kinase [Planctomycetota bacterium]
MLALDIGNTKARLAWLEEGVVREHWLWPTRELTSAGLTPLLARQAKAGETLWVASVAPGVNSRVTAAATAVGATCHFLAVDSDQIMPHRLSSPQTTGVDRLLVALGAGGQAPGAYIVIQCGSAATVDWVDSEGFYRGGYILPGPRLWLQGLGLAECLPDLSREDWLGESSEPGDATRSALLGGLAVGLPAAVAAAVARLGEKLGPVPLTLTGGWAGALAPRLANLAPRLVPDLLFLGIARWVAENHRAGVGGGEVGQVGDRPGKDGN